jgi:hypothetical protein
MWYILFGQVHKATDSPGYFCLLSFRYGNFEAWTVPASGVISCAGRRSTQAQTKFRACCQHSIVFPVSRQLWQSSCTCLTLFSSVAMVDSVDLDTFNNLSDEELHELRVKVDRELSERNLTLRSFPRHEDEAALLASVNALDMGKLEKVFVLVAVCRICKIRFL